MHAEEEAQGEGDGAPQIPPDIAAIFRNILNDAYTHAQQIIADVDGFGEDDMELFYDPLILIRGRHHN
jgi:hypothetical protein